MLSASQTLGTIQGVRAVRAECVRVCRAVRAKARDWTCVGLAISNRAQPFRMTHCMLPVVIKGGDQNSDAVSVRQDLLFKEAIRG